MEENLTNVKEQETKETEKKPTFKEKLKNAWDKSKGVIIPVGLTIGGTALAVFVGKKFLDHCDLSYRVDLNGLLKNPFPEDQIKTITTKEVANAVNTERNLYEFYDSVKSTMLDIKDLSLKYGLENVGVMWSSVDETPYIDAYIDGMDVNVR